MSVDAETSTESRAAIDVEANEVRDSLTYTARTIVSEVSVNVESTSTESRVRPLFDDIFDLIEQQRASLENKETRIYWEPMLQAEKKLFANHETKQFRTNAVIKDATWIHMKFQETVSETKDSEKCSIGTN
eukprot:2832397-Karenia_brevis.AAC.1